MMITRTKKMVINMAGLNAVSQYWIVNEAAVISKGLEWLALHEAKKLHKGRRTE